MATFRKTLKISKKRSEYIKKCLSEPILTEEEIVSEDIYFDDGKLVEVKCCGADDETAWCEAVLFDHNGPKEPYFEIGGSEVTDEFLGEWKFETDGNTYIVNVEEE